MLKDRAPKAKGHEGLVANSKKQKEIKKVNYFWDILYFNSQENLLKGKAVSVWESSRDPNKICDAKSLHFPLSTIKE